MKILIVDDDPDIRAILRYTFEDHGWSVVEAADGEEGLKTAAAQSPDVVISDGLMPRMDGFQFLRSIKNHEALRSIPFIFFSAVYTGDREVALAASLGAEAFIVKPKKPEALWKEVNAILDNCRLEKETANAAIDAEDKDYLEKYTHIVVLKLEEKVRELNKEIAERKQIEKVLRETLIESDRRAKEVSALLECSRIILKNREFRKAAEHIFFKCKNVTGATAGYVALLSVDETQNEILFMDPAGLPRPVNAPPATQVSGLCAEAYAGRKAVYHNSLPEIEGKQVVPEGHLPVDNVLFGPMAIGNKVMGLLVFANKPGGFSENDVYLASAFGDLAAISFLNTHTLESLEVSLEALKASEIKYRNLVDNAVIGVYKTTVAGDFLYANEALARMLDFESPVELMAGGVTARYKNLNDRKTLLDHLRREGKVNNFEIELVTKHGAEKGFFLSGVLEGEVLSGMMMDISERKNLEKQIIEIEDRERRRIGHDLHDGLGQLLTGLAFKVRWLGRDLEKESNLHAEYVADLSVLIDEAKEQVSYLSRGLAPVEMDKEGLMNSLTMLSDYTNRMFRIPCSFTCNKPVLIHNEAALTQLYRIAQEAVTNAVKHAKPAHVEISLAGAGDTIRLNVKDDGIGIPEDSNRHRGMGLKIMNYRAGIINAHLDIKRNTDRGTTVTCVYSDVPEKQGL